MKNKQYNGNNTVNGVNVISLKRQIENSINKENKSLDITDRYEMIKQAAERINKG